MFAKKRIRDILKNNGAKRISDTTIDLFNKVLSKIGDEIAFGAVELVYKSGRKTVKDEDIRISTQQFLGKKIEDK